MCYRTMRDGLSLYQAKPAIPRHNRLELSECLVYNVVLIDRISWKASSHPLEAHSPYYGLGRDGQSQCPLPDTGSPETVSGSRHNSMCFSNFRFRRRWERPVRATETRYRARVGETVEQNWQRCSVLSTDYSGRWSAMLTYTGRPNQGGEKCGVWLFRFHVGNNGNMKNGKGSFPFQFGLSLRLDVGSICIYPHCLDDIPMMIITTRVMQNRPRAFIEMIQGDCASVRLEVALGFEVFSIPCHFT